jgi:hypothetical protein
MPAETFPVEVQDLGTFLFRRRTMRDNFAIEGEASRLVGGPVDDPILGAGAMAYATIQRLMVQPPDGWTLDGLNPYEAKAVEQIYRIAGALGEAEARFRGGAA